MKKTYFVFAAIALFFACQPESIHSGSNNRNYAVPEAIDLGLTVKWASFNLGASKPEDYGDFYAWGEIEPKKEYSWSTYKWCNGASYRLTKYCWDTDNWDRSGIPDEKSILDPEDDVAHVKLGGKWRMPTKEELSDLMHKCQWTWIKENGALKGYKITATNGNSILLPFAGDVFMPGSEGLYWSSSIYNDGEAYILWFRKVTTYCNLSSERRYCGLPIRPVSE